MIDERQATPTEQLMQVLKFSEQDLEANRRGEYSSDQERKRPTTGSDTGIIVAVLIAFSIIGFLIAMSQGDARTRSLGALIGGGLFLVWLTSAFISLNYQGGRRDEKGIQEISGQTVVSSDPQGEHYHMEVNERAFEITRELYDVIRDGHFYTFYYDPYAQTMLSAEYGIPEDDDAETYTP